MIKKEAIISLLPGYLIHSKIYSVVVIDLNGYYLYVNEVFRKRYSFISEDFTNIHFQTTIHPDDLEVCSQAAQQCIQNPGECVEIDIRKPNPGHKDYFWTTWEFSLMMNAQNQALGIMAIGYDTTPQKALEKEKLLLSERLEKLAQNIPGFIYQYCIRPDGSSFLPYASPGIEQLLGVAPENLLQSDQESLALVHPDDLVDLLSSAQKSVQELKPWKHEWRTVVNAKVRWLGGSAIPQKMDDGSVIFYGYIQDITDKKLAEQALIQHKETLKETIDNAPGALFQYFIDAEGTEQIFNVNQGLCDILELSRQELKVQKGILWDLVHPEDREATRNSALDAVKRKTSWDWQFRLVTRQGRLKWLYGHATPKFLDDNSTTWYVFVSDITARKQALAELDKVQSLLAETSKIAKIGGWEFDPEADTIIWTPEVYRIYGVDSSYVPNKIQNQDFYPPEDREKLYEGYLKAIQFGIPLDLELGFTNAQNQSLWVHIKGKPIYKDDKVVKLQGTIQDITEQKTAQQKIRDSEIKLKAMYDSTGDHNFFISPDYTILFFNKRVKDFIQQIYQIEIQEGQNILDYILDEVRPGFLENFQKSLQGEITHTEMEIDFGGFQTWFQVSYFPVYDQDNKLIGIANNLSDITERKQAEKLLEQTLEKYTSLINTIDGIVWEADAQTLNFTFVSKQAENILGYPIQQWFEPGFWMNTIHEEDREAVIAYRKREMQLGNDHDFEYRMLAADGRIVWLRDLVVVVSENGRPLKLRGLMIDITTKKKSEQFLIESEERFRNMIEVSPIPKFLMDTKGKIIFTSRAFKENYGYSLDDIPDFETWLLLAHPDPNYRRQAIGFWLEQKNLQVHAETAFQAKELHIHCKDGSDRIALAGMVWLNKDSGHYVLITLYDITEIKKYEQKILSQNQTLKIISWIQSHQVRKPLATIMGLIGLIKEVGSDEKDVYLEHLYTTALELDEIIHQIVRKTEILDDTMLHEIPLEVK